MCRCKDCKYSRPFMIYMDGNNRPTHMFNRYWCLREVKPLIYTIKNKYEDCKDYSPTLRKIWEDRFKKIIDNLKHIFNI